jgi:hypothetical protein
VPGSLVAFAARRQRLSGLTLANQIANSPVVPLQFVRESKRNSNGLCKIGAMVGTRKGELIMASHMPPIPPGNQSKKGPKSDADAARDTSKGHKGIQNVDEQGDTANTKQNTTNAGFFKGRRVK